MIKSTEDALKLLGANIETPEEEIKRLFNDRYHNSHAKLGEAPTKELKAKNRKELEKLEEAFCILFPDANLNEEILNLPSPKPLYTIPYPSMEVEDEQIDNTKKDKLRSTSIILWGIFLIVIAIAGFVGTYMYYGSIKAEKERIDWLVNFISPMGLNKEELINKTTSNIKNELKVKNCYPCNIGIVRITGIVVDEDRITALNSGDFFCNEKFGIKSTSIIRPGNTKNIEIKFDDIKWTGTKILYYSIFIAIQRDEYDDCRTVYELHSGIWTKEKDDDEIINLIPLKNLDYE